MGKQHRVNGINVEDYKGTLQNRKSEYEKIQKEIDKNTLSIEEQDNVARYVADFEKKQAEEERAKQVALELVEKEAAYKKDYADKQKVLAQAQQKDADARKAVANKVKPVGPVVAPEVQEQEEAALYKIAEETKANPIFVQKQQELDALLAKQTKGASVSKMEYLESGPDAGWGEKIAKGFGNIAPSLVNGVSGLLDAGFDSILPASNDQKKVEKLQEELKGAKAPGVKLKKQQIQKQNETIQRLHDASTDSFERGRLNVELYNNEREIRGLDNVLDPKVGYVIGELISTIVDTNEKEGMIIPFPHQTSQLINFFQKDELEKKYQNQLVGPEGETDEEAQVRLSAIPEKDMAMLQSYSLRDEAQAQTADMKSFGHNTINQMGGSLDMIAEMMLTEGAAGLLSKGAGIVARGTRVAEVGEKLAFLEKGYISQASKDLYRSMGPDKVSKMLTKTTAVGMDGAVLGAKFEAMNLMDPHFINEGLSKGSNVVRDEQGKITNIYVQDNYYKLMQRTNEGIAQSYKNKLATLGAKANLTPEEEAEVAHMEIKLGKRFSAGEQTLEEEIETFRPLGLFEASMTGLRKQAAEGLAEVYTGALLGNLGKGLVKLGKGKSAFSGLGKFAIRTEKAVGELGEEIATGRAKLVNSTKLTKFLDKKLSGKALVPTFNGQKITGTVEELPEEYFTSAVNSIFEGDPKEFMDTTFDLQSNKDILIQTALLNAGFGAVGSMQTSYQLGVNKLGQARIDEATALKKNHTESIAENNVRIKDAEAKLASGTLSIDETEQYKNQVVNFKAANLSSNTAIAQANKNANKEAKYSDIRKYNDARNSTREAINGLRLANKDSDLNQILNIQSLGANNIELQNKEIKRFRAEGKTESADMLEKLMFNNVVSNAVQAGQLSELSTVLKRAGAKGSLNVETQKTLVRASEHVTELNRISEVYKDHPLLNKLLKFQYEKMNLEEGIEDNKAISSTLSVQARKEIEADYPGRGFNIDEIFTPGNTTFSPAELEMLERGHEGVSNYSNSLKASEQMQEVLDSTNKIVAKLRTEPQHEINKQRVEKEMQDLLGDIQDRKTKSEGIDNVDDEYLNDTENVTFDAEGQLVVNTKLIDFLFEKNKENFVGKWATDNKINDKAYKDIKTKFDQFAVLTMNFKRYKDMQASAQASAAAETPNQTPITPEVVIVRDEDAEGNIISDIENFTSDLDDSFDDEDVAANEGELIDYSIDNYAYTPEQLEVMKKGIAHIYGMVATLTNNPSPSFTDVMEQFYKYSKDKNNVKKYYNHLVRGWTELGHTVTSAETMNLYNKFFDIASDIESITDSIFNMYESPQKVISVPPVETVVTQTAKLEQTIADGVVVQDTLFDDENNPSHVEQANKTLTERVSQGLTPWIGYSAQAYEIVTGEDGVVRKVTSGTELNPVDKVNYLALLDPDAYPNGAPMGVKIAPESDWATTMVSNGRNAKGERVLTPFSSWLSRREAANPNFRSTQEFLDKVPMYYTSMKGEPIGYVKDIDGYNAYDIDNPFGPSTNQANPTKPWQDHINAGIANARALRENINSGLTEVTVERRSKEGIMYVIPMEQEQITLEESNPQSVVATLNRTGSKGLLQNLDEGFAKGSKVLLNKEEDFDGSSLGHSFYVYRVGTDVLADGKVVETYRASKFERYPNASQVESVANAIHIFNLLSDNKYKAVSQRQTINAKNGRQENFPSTTNNTPEDRRYIIETFVDPILDATGYNISKIQDLTDFIRMHFQISAATLMELRLPTDRKSYDSSSLILYKRLFANYSIEDIIAKDMLTQHTLSAALGSKVGMVAVGTEKVELLQKDGKKMTYHDYIKANSKTNIKAFNVGTEAKPIYATIIQPVIHINYKSVAKQEKPASTLVEETVAPVFKKLEEKKKVEVSEHIDFLNTLGIEVEDELYDEMIDNVDAIVSIFNLTGNLDIEQEQAIRKFIVSNIGKKIVDEYKLDPKKKITPEVKNNLSVAIEFELTQIVNNLKSKITVMQAKLEGNTDAKSLQVKDKYEETLTNLNTIVNEYTKLFDKAFEDLKQQTKIVDSETDAEDILDVKQFGKESIEADFKGSIDPDLRLFLNSIAVYDKKGVPVSGYLGLPSYMDFNDVFNQLTKNITLSSEIPSDYDSLIRKLKESKTPFVADVLAKLEGSSQQIKNKFLTTFVKHTLQSKFGMYENTASGVKLKMYDTNANEITRVLKKRWINDTKASNLYTKEGSFNAEFAESLLTQFAAIDVKTENGTKELRSWLEQIGLYLEEGSWDQIVAKGIYNKQDYDFNDLLTLEAGGLTYPILKFLNEAKANPLDYEFTSENTVFKEMSGVINGISAVEALYNPQLISLAFRDSGKDISTQVPTKFITDRVAELKRSASDSNNTLIEDLQSLSFSDNSIMLQLLKENKNFKSLFKISHVGITAFKEKGDTPTKAGLNNLSDMDYYLTTLTGFQDRKGEEISKNTKIGGFTIRMANMLNLTMSDKTTNVFLRTGVFDFLADASTAFYPKENGNQSLTKRTTDLLFDQLVASELKRIVNFHNNVKSTNVADYDKAAQVFHLIPGMNNVKDEKGVRIIDILGELASQGNLDYDKIVELHKDKFVATLENVVEKEVNHFSKLWEGQVVKSNKMFDAEYFSKADISLTPSKDFKLGVYDYVLNSMLHQADLFKVFAGDVSMYAKDKQVGEVGPENTKTDEQYISLNKTIGVNLGKRLALLIAPGNKIANSYKENYNQIFLKDSIDIAENSEYLVGLFYGEKGIAEAKPLLEKYAIEAKVVADMEQGVGKIDPAILAAAKSNMKVIRDGLAKKFPSLDGYFDLESTDAQEYTTAKEHVDIIYRLGRMSDEEHAGILATLAKPGREGHLNKQQLAIVLQPIKPVHTGTYFNKGWDMNRVVYIKSSSFPLLPQFTQGNRLNDLRLKMEELHEATGNGVRASFKTANKVGSVKSENEVNPFDKQSLEKVMNGYNAATKTFDENGANNSVVVLSRDNFRIQQDVPFKSDKKKSDTVSMGTQFFKLLFGDGVINEDGFKLNPTDTETLTGKQLYDHYNESFAKIVDIKKKQLFSKLGLEEDGTVKNEAKFVKNLQDLLVKEAIAKGMSLKSVRGLKIEKLQAKLGYYYEFKTPLWLSSDSNRYESLLNSLIGNAVMHHKMPGNAFVAGSESGFAYSETMEGIEESDVIYLDNYNGKELQGTHTTSENGEVKFHKAQVFVTSKFKDNNNELIDLFEGFDLKTGNVANAKYLKRNENGSLGLKEDMIDPMLFNNFSFRTPTSSHVSGSSIEIVGILPAIQGDLMIVPKNFTKQKGLDYDVDKESAYQLNHFLTDSGKIKVLDRADIETITSGLKDKIEKFNLENTSTSRKSSFANELFSAFVQGQGNLLDEESLESLLLPQLDIIDKLNYLESELERKLAENEFIKVHLAVYNNPSVKIQSKINKILSIDYAKEQAEKLEKINSLGEKNKYINERKAEGLSRDEAKLEYEQMNSNFTFLSYAYQKQKMDLGTIGKAAIGVYANFTTLNGLIQQNGSEIFIRDKKGNPKPLTIGNYTAKGILGQEMTVDGSRSIADVLAERENIATDNEKEQVLGRVGVNEQTINIDAYLTLMGFDKDENGNSIPFLMLSQPVIVNLNKQLRDAKGVLGEYINKNELIATTISTLTSGSIIYTEVKGIWKFRNAIDNQEVEDFMGGKLTGKNMLESIEKNDTTSETQAAALMNYVNLEKEVAEVANAQSVVDTNNLGKSIIESQLKYEKLKKITENSVLGNASKLIGDFLSKEMYFTKPEGYYDIGEYWVKPTTPQGQIAITGLQLGHTLFKDFFPYQDTSLTAIVEENLRLSGKDPDRANEESYEEVLTDIKKYLFSSEANNIFEGNAQVKRHETLIDDESNTSLSTYIKDTLRSATNTRGISSLKKNALISSFEFITGKLPGELSLINYSNTSVDNNNQELMYNAIPSLIMSNLKLPNRNGEAYTTRMLAEDLIAYSYLEGGVQEATQFVKFIPVEVLETIGKYEQSRFINAEGKSEARRVFKSANRKLQGLNPNRMNTPEGGENGMFGRLLGLSPVEGSFSTFTKQRFQHNPSLAPKIYSKGITNVKNAEGTFTLKEESKGKNLPFLSMAIKDKGKTSYVLYQNVGAMNYQRISLLGQNGVSEYQYGVLSAFSLGETKIQNLKANNSLLEGNEAVDLKLEEDTTVGTVLEKIKNLVLSEDFAFITEAAKFLEQFGNPNIGFELGTDIVGAGASYVSDLKVKLKPSMTTGVSVEKTAVTFLHEYIHTITTRELEKYYDSDFINLRKDVTIPTHVTALHISFSQFRAKYAAEIASMKFKKDNKLSFSEDDKSIYYAGYNIKEFMTMSLTSKNFQDAMSQVPYMKSGVSYLDKILATIMKFMENIYPNLKEGSVAHDAVGKSLRFIEKERAEQQLSYYELLSNSQLGSLDSKRLGVQTIDTTKEVDKIKQLVANKETFAKLDEENINNQLTNGKYYIAKPVNNGASQEYIPITKDNLDFALENLDTLVAKSLNGRMSNYAVPVTNWNVQISRSESLDYEEYKLEEIYQEMMAENVNAEEKAAFIRFFNDLGFNFNEKAEEQFKDPNQTSLFDDADNMIDNNSVAEENEVVLSEEEKLPCEGGLAI
jgi:hypothetical protein